MAQTQQIKNETVSDMLTWGADDHSDHLDPADVFAAGVRNHNIANTAYPIAHRRTIWRYRQEADRHRALLTEAFAAAPTMGLYVHVPFCQARCKFCEYCVVDRHTKEAETEYFKALFRELKAYDGVVHGKPLVGVDFGGGTPALVDPTQIGALVRYIDDHFVRALGFSMSIETTPKLAAAHPERMVAYRGFDIDRISMGIQTVSPKLLERYGRDQGRLRHNRDAARNIRRAGFERFNIDLMYGFADQTVEDFLPTLAHTLSLEPDYVTLYRMRYKGTRVKHEAADVQLHRVNDIYAAAHERLDAQGYRANYGKNGFSRIPGDPGTSAYLTGRVVDSVPYLGTGLGAQTFTNSLLAYNLGAAEKRLDGYLAANAEGRLPIQDLYLLSPSEAMAKMISVAFYFGEVDLDAFEGRFGVDFTDRYRQQVAFVLDRELMAFHGRRLRFTRKGAQHFGGVVALFYSGAVQEYLLEV
ncbi:MAG: radical SAM protein [bacterium]